VDPRWLRLVRRDRIAQGLRGGSRQSEAFGSALHRLAGMQWLATQCARGARDWASAVEFSNNLKRLASTGNDSDLRARVAQVAQEAERELAIERANAGRGSNATATRARHD
jgi:hypothetical protein